MSGKDLSTILIARHLQKRFGIQTVLDDVSLELRPGTITTVIGPSGSGKSTLLRAIALLEAPDAGTIEVDGSCFRFPLANGQRNPAPPWPKITVVFQQLFLWPHLTLGDNIWLPLKNHSKDYRKDVVTRTATEIGIIDLLDRFPNEVSLGQRQLAAIARALALKPTYLLLDEITSALDVEFVARILQLVRKRRDEGAGILLITHYLDFARSSADQVLFIENARIVERGPREILTTPRTERLSEFLSLILTAR